MLAEQVTGIAGKAAGVTKSAAETMAPVLENTISTTGALETAATPTGPTVSTEIKTTVTEATAAAEKLETGLNQGNPQEVLQDLVNPKENLEPTVEFDNATELPQQQDLETSKAFDETIPAVKPEIQSWEQNHPPPDQNADSTKINQWLQERASEEKQLTVNTATEIQMKQWDEKNPEPDQINQEEHSKWQEKRNNQEEQMRKKQEKLYDQQEKQKIEQKLGMTKEEFMKKIIRLQELQKTSLEISSNIQKLKGSRHQTETLKKQLNQSQEILNQVNAEITNLMAELQLDSTVSNDPLKKLWLISMLLLPVLTQAMTEAEKGT